MIRKVSFRNFKAYRSLDVELEPLTVLVGPNASGKTTLLEGMLLVTGASEGLGEKPYVEMTQGNLLTREAKPPVEISLAGAWGDIGGTITLKGHPRAPPKSVAVPWHFFFSGELNGQVFPDVKQRPQVGFPLITSQQGRKLRAEMKATAILRFEPRRLAEASYSEDEVPRVNSDGSGLASVLAHLKLTDDSRFNAIESELTRIVPAVEKIRVERAAVEVTTLRSLAIDEQRHEVPERRTLWGNRIVFDMKGAQGVSADAAGEGTLLALGLLTVVMGPGQPKLVLLDDIELALHPVAQGKLVEVIRKLQNQNPELQIVATSHSPFILNYLDPKEVRMTFLTENGFARCEKLTAHPEFEKWKDLMTPGEFWSTVGESWLEKVGEASAHE
jgi:predicted ATPase